MICPKCQNLMQTVDRRGIHIEQCQGCRGIFLDRGELEQIANAESNFYGGQAAPGMHAAPPPVYRDSPPAYGTHAAPHPGSHGVSHGAYDPRYQGGHYRDSPPPYGGHGQHGYGHKRRKGFLEELFD